MPAWPLRTLRWKFGHDDRLVVVDEMDPGAAACGLVCILDLSCVGGGEVIQPIRPSETTDFIRCPRLWRYKHVDGWQAPMAAWTPWQLMGTAIHAGLAVFWRTGAKPEAWAAQALRDGWPADAPPEFSRDGLEAQALKVLDKVLTWCAKEMPDATPLMVEEPLGADGHTIP